MKSLLLVILSLSFTLKAFGQQTPIDYPDSGFTNKAEAKNQMVNGVREGKWIEYSDRHGFIIPDTSGAESYVLTVYKSGNPYGIGRGYYNKSGKILVICPFINGKVSGIEKQYYESGKLHLEAPYIDGDINGVKKVYYESGKLISETLYSSGEKIGIAKGYYENGTLMNEEPYTNGQENGIVKWYFENGKSEIEVPYKNGKLDGVSNEYFENGKLKVEVHYMNDTLNGLEKRYYKSGKLNIETVNIKGKENGVRKTYYESGEIESEETYVDGNSNGTTKVYYKSKHDSLLSDSLFSYYSDFRIDANGKLGLRIKYFKTYRIPFEGLSKQRLIQFLGKPDGTTTVKDKDDSLQKTIFEYKIGSETERKESYSSVGFTYILRVFVVKDIAVKEFDSYSTDTWAKQVGH